MRAIDGPFQRRQLLTEGDVLKEDRLMAPAGEHRRSDNDYSSSSTNLTNVTIRALALDWRC